MRSFTSWLNKRYATKINLRHYVLPTLSNKWPLPNRSGALPLVALNDPITRHLMANSSNWTMVQLESVG